MRKIFALSCIIVSLFISGCATNSSFETFNSELKLSPIAKFEVGDVQNRSKYATSEKDINIVETMRDALVAALMKSDLYGKNYKINVVIQEYKPGNAFARWVLPGLGETYLQTRSYVINTEGKTIAVIPAMKNVWAGGAFTVGAWRECFKDVAEETVNTLKKELINNIAS